MRHYLPKLANRDVESHKGDFGHVVLIGGSRGMAGAIAIAAMATLRSGAGLTTVAVPAVSLDVVAAFHPCYMTYPLPCDADGTLDGGAMEALRPLVERSQVLAIGPGLGRSSAARALVVELYVHAKQAMVVDADALYALSEEWGGALPVPGGPRILTPHAGEFERLTGVDRHDREGQCLRGQSWAAERGVVLILKGSETMIADARQTVYNTTGNPGMASGGSGDCLTGILAALLAQGMTPFESAHLGVHVHGFAGDIAHRKLGGPSVLATDLIPHLPEAFSRSHQVMDPE